MLTALSHPKAFSTLAISASEGPNAIFRNVPAARQACCT